eukprot:CAMPEP_0182431364 /NCGR_PEP_ID=MMETSP1167-20130531/48595_1 /TAXON_ID=2988 /ORGANISM="Mallomonas Sp, Strain CCMP3275" /LENGTH=429 /DNA_ID=CAMNT_0024617625 /DNA_START=94 /DNA_END=1380 /DNA_ORIENTATION=+
MAIRSGCTVGRTTGESSLSDQLHKYKSRQLREEAKKTEKEKLRAANPARESLSSKCIRVIVENFNTRPVKEAIPPPQMALITKQLSTNIDPAVGAKYVHDENFWKRCCVEKFGWHNCHLVEHGLLWKQMFFEKFIQERLEDFDPSTENVNDLYEQLDSCMDYIFTITFKQLPSHLDMSDICTSLPNLSKLDITYGVKKIGMHYERMLFGMKISDATSLARTFEHSTSLTTLLMTGNMIDDDLLRMLMTGLIKNNTITYLDISHNKITNHGARLLSKLMGENCVISTLNLADNQIHTEGGRYLARGLRENESLLHLNLRLNRLGDEGCKLLMEGLHDNITLTDINIGSNSAGRQTAHVLCSLLREEDCRLIAIDLCSNELQFEDVDRIRATISTNHTLCRLDLRRNDGYEDDSRTAQEIDKTLYTNETQW